MTRFSRWDTTARLGYLTAAVITARLGYLTAAVITARLGYLTAVITVSAILTAIMTLRAPRRAADDETRKQPWELSTGAFQAR